MASKVPCCIVVAGRLDDYKFHMAKAIALDLSRRFEQVTVQHYGLLEVDWLDYLGSKLKELSLGSSSSASSSMSHKTSPLVFYNTVNYIGSEQDLIAWALRAYRYNASEAFVNKEGYQELNTVLFRRLAKKEYAAWLTSQKSQFVFMDLQQGGQQGEEGTTQKKGRPLGRVVFELFASVLPQTCQNFVDLCTGERGTSQSSGTKLSYEGSVIHRVVQDTWIQGGDICGGAGDGGESARGELLADENFSVKHDKPGVLAMANSGPHSNHSQFYITLLPMPWLDTKNVAFGRVIQGMRTVNIVSKAAAMNQRPLEDITIAKCGLFVGGEDGGALMTSAKRPITQRALLKQVFTEATNNDPRQSCRHSELLLVLKAEGSTLRSKFSGQAEAVIAAVEKDAIESGKEVISLDTFVKVSMGALSLLRGKSSRTQRKLDDALEADAEINAPLGSTENAEVETKEQEGEAAAAATDAETPATEAETADAATDDAATAEAAAAAAPETKDEPQPETAAAAVESKDEEPTEEQKEEPLPAPTDEKLDAAEESKADESKAEEQPAE